MGFRSSTTMLRLRKCIYGNPDAPLRLSESINEALLDLGWTRFSIFDEALYLLLVDEEDKPKQLDHDDPNANLAWLWERFDSPGGYPFVPLPKGISVAGVLCLHVDDALHTGTEAFYRPGGHLDKLKERLGVGNEDVGHLFYCGRRTVQSSNCNKVVCCSKEYAQRIKEHNLGTKSEKLDQELDEAELKVLRSLKGKLQWLSGQRPDIALPVADLHNLPLQRGTIARANKVVRTANHRYSKLSILDLQGDVTVLVCADAADYRHGKDTRGIMFFLMETRQQPDETYRVVPWKWSARKQTRKSSSTHEAKLTVLTTGLAHGIHLRGWLISLGLQRVKRSVIVVPDNKSAVQQSQTSTKVRCSEMSPAMNFFRQQCKEGLATLLHVSGPDNIADPLTKTEAARNPVKLLEVLESGRVKLPRRDRLTF